MSIELNVDSTAPLQSIRDEVKQIFKNFDTDNSGELNLKEALESGAPDENIFRQADADGNGGVSQEELQTFFRSFDEAIDSGAFNPNDLVSALKNAKTDIIEQLLQALKEKDEKSVKSILDRLLEEDKENTKQDTKQGTLVHAKA